MTNSNSLLSRYQELVQNHVSRFSPEIADLQQLVEARVQALREREQTLVEAQVMELKRITDALARDARCLLPTPEFKEFVQGLAKIKSNNWYTKSKPSIAEDPNTWLLTSLELPIGLSNYQTHVDPDGYDDERTYIGYSYTLSLKLGSVEHSIEIPDERIYNVNERRQTSIREQIDYYISGDVEDLLRDMNYLDEQKQKLAHEISLLVGYSTKIFALKPTKVIFEYTSTQEG